MGEKGRGREFRGVYFCCLMKDANAHSFSWLRTGRILSVPFVPKEGRFRSILLKKLLLTLEDYWYVCTFAY